MIIIGHRGARGLAPENSLASFDKAIEHHVDYIEFDVRLTKDRQLVVIHDRHTKRVAFVKERIRTLTLEEVRAIATRDGIPIPTLEEVLKHLVGRTKLNIEIKNRGTAAVLLEKLQPYLKTKKLRYEDFLVSTSRLGELKTVHALDSKVRLGLLQRRFPLRFLTVPKPLLFAVGFKHITLSRRMLQRAKSRGLFTYAYTVNSPTRVATLQKWGLDAVCTDRPDIIQS